MLIYEMTWGELLLLSGFLEKNNQFGWLDTLISVSPSLLVELEIWQMVNYDGS